MKPLVFLSLATLVAVGCGGTTNPRTGEPSGPQPRHGKGSPPPAWIETAAGAHWLAYSSYCWSSGGVHSCADFVAPSCERAPKVEVQRDETVRFHLGFEPKEISLNISGSHTEKLSPARNPEWKVSSAGVLTLVATARKAGDASYVACLRLTPAP